MDGFESKPIIKSNHYHINTTCNNNKNTIKFPINGFLEHCHNNNICCSAVRAHPGIFIN